MIGRMVLALLVVVVAFAAGYLAGGRQAAPTMIPLSCTPSAPQVVTARAEGPVVLFWGNSLLHDHQWRIGGATSVNCAVQGLTAAAAAPLVPSLPNVAPDAIVLAFGSVELVRASKGVASDANAIAKAVRANLAALKARWPLAMIVLSSAPAFAQQGGDGIIDLDEAEALNGVLSLIAGEAAGVSYFEMRTLYDASRPELPAAATYDGVHLTGQAYARWEAALEIHLSSLR